MVTAEAVSLLSPITQVWTFPVQVTYVHTLLPPLLLALSSSCA